MSHSLASAKNNSCYLFALFMLYLYVSTEMERVFNLKQVHRPIQLNCSGLWESKQKKYFDNIPLFYHAVPFAEIQDICANLLSENKQAYPFENVLLGTNRYPVLTRTFFVFSNKMTFF